MPGFAQVRPQFTRATLRIDGAFPLLANPLHELASITLRRLETLTLAVMGQLHARGNWHRIAREWMLGDAPVTELGEADAAFFGNGRAPSPT